MVYNMFIKTFKDTFYQININKKSLFLSNFLPFLVMVISSIRIEAPQIPSYIMGVIYLVGMIVECVMVLFIIVNVHKIILEGNGSVSKWGNLNHGLDECNIYFKFIANYFMIVFVGVIVGVIIYLIGYSPLSKITIVDEFFSYVLLFFVGMLTCRFFLVFPAIAIKNDISLTDALELTKGRILYMFGIVFALPLLLKGILMLLMMNTKVTMFFYYVFGFSALGILDSLSLFIVILYSTTLLSVAYKHIMGQSQGGKELNELSILSQ